MLNERCGAHIEGDSALIGRTKEARQAMIYVLWSSTGVGATWIGGAFGVKHAAASNAAASNAARNLERRLPKGRSLRQRIERIRRRPLTRDQRGHLTDPSNVK